MSASDADLHNPFILAIRVVELFERFIGHPSLRRSANTTALSLKSEERDYATPRDTKLFRTAKKD